MTRTIIAALPLAFALSGCISVKAPDKPIEINLNVNIKQEVVVRLQRDAPDLAAVNVGDAKMKTKAIIAALALGMATLASAQGSEVRAAIDAGQVGEQADGFLGVRGSVSAAIRAEVEAINIKRRAAYTDLAGQRGVTVKDVAAAVGCTTLKTRVGPGEAYLLRDGVWRTRAGSAPIPLPDYCN